jgi:hypothetical protein
MSVCIYDAISNCAHMQPVICTQDKQRETIQRMGYVFVAQDSIGNELYATRKRYAFVANDGNDNRINLYDRMKAR